MCGHVGVNIGKDQETKKRLESGRDLKGGLEKSVDPGRVGEYQWLKSIVGKGVRRRHQLTTIRHENPI